MTPQLQQAIKLLQLSRMELVDLIQTEMVENPMLEEAPDNTGPVELGTDRLAAEVMDNERHDDTAQAEQAVQEIDWERYLENYSSPLPASGGAAPADDMPGYDQTLTRSDGLVEHLLHQLGTMEANEEERSLAEVIICNLDDDGYLRGTTLEEIAERWGSDIEMVEDALSLVQELDPLGVGARSLSECLEVQARILYPEDDVVIAVVRDHIADLERKNYAGIARALGVSRERVMDAHRTITTFEPRPGRAFGEDTTEYIVPDIWIVKQDDDWVPMLNEDGLPRLRVSDYYRRTLRGSGEKDAKNYVQERLRSAWWLIRSIQQRQRTIIKVTESVIRFQRDFFDKGIDHLKPLVLRDVANDIGMHESTVSRVTTNKYVHTPRGIYELKFFFNSSIRTDGGDDIAAESVKHHIKQLVSEEDPARPFSDQKLVELLHDKHQIEIARRTVAKYRESLGILSSSKRKQLI